MSSNFKKSFFVAAILFIMHSNFNNLDAIDIPQGVYVNNNQCYVGMCLSGEQQMLSENNNESIKEFLLNVVQDKDTRQLTSDHACVRVKFKSNGQDYVLVISRSYVFNWSRSGDNDRFQKFTLLLGDLRLDSSVSNNFKINKTNCKKAFRGSGYVYKEKNRSHIAGFYTRAAGNKK